ANVQIQQQRKTQSRPPLLWPSSVPLIPNMAAQKDNIVPYRSVEVIMTCFQSGKTLKWF
ncbi:unnamed protein product, partial [Brassica rapa]